MIRNLTTALAFALLSLGSAQAQTTVVGNFDLVSNCGVDAESASAGPIEIVSSFRFNAAVAAGSYESLGEFEDCQETIIQTSTSPLCTPWFCPSTEPPWVNCLPGITCPDICLYVSGGQEDCCSDLGMCAPPSWFDTELFFGLAAGAKNSTSLEAAFLESARSMVLHERIPELGAIDWEKYLEDLICQSAICVDVDLMAVLQSQLEGTMSVGRQNAFIRTDLERSSQLTSMRNLRIQNMLR